MVRVPSTNTEAFTVEFSGELTIRSMANVHRQLLDAFAGHSSVTGRVADDAAVDLTFVQLIESARRSARDDGKTFRLASAATGSLLETLERGGFLADAERRDFWLSGDL